MDLVGEVDRMVRAGVTADVDGFIGEASERRAVLREEEERGGQPGGVVGLGATL